jgi:hypothetical protein
VPRSLVLQPTGGTDVTNWDGRPGGDAEYDDALPGQDVIFQTPGGVLVDQTIVDPLVVPPGFSWDYLTRNIQDLLFPGGFDLGVEEGGGGPGPYDITWQGEPLLWQGEPLTWMKP